MKRTHLVAIGFLLWTITAVAAAADKPSRLEQIARYYASSRQFTGTILVARHGKILLDRGYGAANLEWGQPNSPQTKFCLASLTKQFTAACILLLEERGKLRTDDLVKKYLPDAPAAWDKITIYNLLTHTSGIPNYTSFSDYDSVAPLPTSPVQLMARFRDKPLDFTPGQGWGYSNSGYVLLGYLIEKISGQRYADFVQENIFRPLGMRDSGYDANSVIIPHLASGYSPTLHGKANAGYVDMTVLYSAGALYSTSHDLLRWTQGLFGGKLLTPKALKKMTTPFRDDYACGLVVRTESGRPVIEHNGGIQGFSTELSYYPNEGLTVVVLGNLETGAPPEMAAKLAAAADGETLILPSEREEVGVSPSILADYVGTYRLAPGFDISITRAADRLTATATGQPAHRLFAEAPGRFFVKDLDAQLRFIRGDSGAVTGLILHYRGQDRAGVRQ